MMKSEPGPEHDLRVADAIGVVHSRKRPYDLSGGWAVSNTACGRCGSKWETTGDHRRCASDFDHCVSCRGEWERELEESKPPKPYSTDLNAAFEAAGKVFPYGFQLSVNQYDDVPQQFKCVCHPNMPPDFRHGTATSPFQSGHGTTAALAICKAILELRR